MCVCMGGVEVEVEVEVEEEDNVADFQDEIAKTGNLVWAETVPRTAIRFDLGELPVDPPQLYSSDCHNRQPIHSTNTLKLNHSHNHNHNQ